MCDSVAKTISLMAAIIKCPVAGVCQELRRTACGTRSEVACEPGESGEQNCLSWAGQEQGLRAAVCIYCIWLFE